MQEPQPLNLGPDHFKRKWKRRRRRAIEKGLTHARLPTGRPNLGPFWGTINTILLFLDKLVLDKLRHRRGH